MIETAMPLAAEPNHVRRVAHVACAIAARLCGQGAVTLAVTASLVWLWRSEADYALKAAALCSALILATPYA